MLVEPGYASGLRSLTPGVVASLIAQWPVAVQNGTAELSTIA